MSADFIRRSRAAKLGRRRREERLDFERRSRAAKLGHRRKAKRGRKGKPKGKALAVPGLIFSGRVFAFDHRLLDGTAPGLTGAKPRKGAYFAHLEFHYTDADDEEASISSIEGFQTESSLDFWYDYYQAVREWLEMIVDKLGRKTGGSPSGSVEVTRIERAAPPA